MSQEEKEKWDGPYDFQTAIKEWSENDKTIMYQFENNGIPFDRGVINGRIPTTHNLAKNHITKAKWYIEKS